MARKLWTLSDERPQGHSPSRKQLASATRKLTQSMNVWQRDVGKKIHLQAYTKHTQPDSAQEKTAEE